GRGNQWRRQRRRQQYAAAGFDLRSICEGFVGRNPSAPEVFSWQVQPNLDVQFNLNVQGAGEGVHEVTLKFDISARSDNGVHFVVDLSYAGLFAIQNVPEEAMPPFLLIEAPRLLFPFARQVISEAVSNTGFPPLMLDPIDFAA